MKKRKQSETNIESQQSMGQAEGFTVNTESKDYKIYDTSVYNWYETQNPVVQTAIAIPAAFAVAGAEVGGAVGIEAATGALSVETVAQIDVRVNLASRSISKMGKIGAKVAPAIPATWEKVKNYVNKPYSPAPSVFDVIKKVYDSGKSEVVKIYNKLF